MFTVIRSDPIRSALLVAALAFTGSLSATAQESPSPQPSGKIVHVPADYATIQEAVAAARRGDRIEVADGIYHGTVQIVGAEKDGLQIVGDGARLVGSGGVFHENCNWGREDEGRSLCVEGRAGFYLRDVSHVLIRGFTVSDFGLGPMSCLGEGFLLINAHDSRFEHNTVTRTDMMGATLYDSGRNVFEHNLIYLNDPHEPGRCGTGCGFHIQNLPAAEGVPARGSAAENVIRRNVIWGNPLAGVMIASAGAGNQIVENVIHDGRAWGIMVRRTEGTLIRDNQIMRHPGFRHEVPEHVSEEMKFGVGYGIDIRLSSGTSVLNNRVGESSRYDLIWDGEGAGNVFAGNRCGMASSAGLCAPE